MNKGRPMEEMQYAPSPYTELRKPPFWEPLLSNLRSCPSLSYAVAMTTFRVGSQVIQLTDGLLSRYMQTGIEFVGVFYPAGGQEAHAQLKAASGQLLVELISEIPSDPRLVAAVDRLYPSAFPKTHDPIDDLMTKETGVQRHVPPEVAEQMMRDMLEARGFRVIGPNDASMAVAKPREVYQPLPEPDDGAEDVEVIDEMEARRGVVVEAGEG